MTQIREHRPLGGNTASGLPVAVPNGSTVTLHTLDGTSAQNGGPYIDELSLWVSNGSGGALNLTLTVGGGTPIVTAVAAGALVQVLDKIPFRSSGASVLAQGNGAGLVAWGYFVRG